MHNIFYHYENKYLVEGPADVQVPEYDIHSTSVKVSWTEAKGAITGYRVHCTEKNFPNSWHVSSHELCYVIQDLKPGTKYIIGVSAMNREVESLPTWLSVKTKPGERAEFKVMDLISVNPKRYI